MGTPFVILNSKSVAPTTRIHEYLPIQFIVYVTGWMTGVHFLAGAMGPTHPPMQWVPGDLSPGVNRQRRQADYLPPSTTEVSVPQIFFHSVVLD